MVNILPKKNDDIKFTRIVSQILNNTISLTNPNEVYIIQIDHRFDYKWLGFSHKSLGQRGRWQLSKLRVPPFVLEKVVEELFFQNVDGKFNLKSHNLLHIHQTSEDNNYRLIQNITDSGIFIWYSGNTKVNSQASVIVYTNSQKAANYWFVSFINNGTWQIRGTENISKNEIEMLMETDVSASVW